MTEQNILTIEKLQKYGSAFCPVNSSDELDGFLGYARIRGMNAHEINLSLVTMSAHRGGQTPDWKTALAEHKRLLDRYAFHPAKTVFVCVGSTEGMPDFVIEGLRALTQIYGFVVFHTEFAGVRSEGNSNHSYVRKHGLRFRVVDSLAQQKTESETSNLP